jgi:hypothetical protein
MKFSQIPAVILLLFLSHPELNAETMYKWTDENGVIHLTNQRPPGEIAIQKIISYEDRTAKEIKKYQEAQEKNRHERLIEQKTLNAQESRIRADKARLKAEKAIDVAEEAMKKAQEYMEKKAPRKRQKRDAYRKKLRRIVQTAKDSVARANREIKLANQAEQEAIEAVDALQKKENKD